MVPRRALAALLVLGLLSAAQYGAALPDNPPTDGATERGGAATTPSPDPGETRLRVHAEALDPRTDTGDARTVRRHYSFPLDALAEPGSFLWEELSAPRRTHAAVRRALRTNDRSTSSSSSIVSDLRRLSREFDYVETSDGEFVRWRVAVDEGAATVVVEARLDAGELLEELLASETVALEWLDPSRRTAVEESIRSARSDGSPARVRSNETRLEAGASLLVRSGDQLYLVTVSGGGRLRGTTTLGPDRPPESNAEDTGTSWILLLVFLSPGLVFVGLVVLFVLQLLVREVVLPLTRDRRS